MWRALQQHIPQPDDLISSRDRAILMLLMELGLTPEEVKHLEVGNLRWSEDEPRVIQSLLVAGERDMQTRTLPVSPSCTMPCRPGCRRAQATTPCRARALFCTRKARS